MKTKSTIKMKSREVVNDCIVTTTVRIKGRVCDRVRYYLNRKKEELEVRVNALTQQGNCYDKN